jgi:tRNA pseudouridine13 synthase
LLTKDLHWRWLDSETLELSFELPAGAYATVVVRELAA